MLIMLQDTFMFVPKNEVDMLRNMSCAKRLIRIGGELIDHVSPALQTRVHRAIQEILSATYDAVLEAQIVVPSKTQVELLRVLVVNNVQYIQGAEVQTHRGHFDWATQEACFKHGWISSRPGYVNSWESYWQIEEDGRIAKSLHYMITCGESYDVAVPRELLDAVK
jgi:hypothetical protein